VGNVNNNQNISNNQNTNQTHQNINLENNVNQKQTINTIVNGNANSQSNMHKLKLTGTKLDKA
jgi:hypothetical protein